MCTHKSLWTTKSGIIDPGSEILCKLSQTVQIALSYLGFTVLPKDTSAGKEGSVYKGINKGQLLIYKQGGSRCPQGNSFCARFYFLSGERRRHTHAQNRQNWLQTQFHWKVMTHTRRMSRDQAALNESSSYASGETHNADSHMRKQDVQIDTDTCAHVSRTQHTQTAKSKPCLGFSPTSSTLPLSFSF